jgi:hypothetical protein
MSKRKKATSGAAVKIRPGPALGDMPLPKLGESIRTPLPASMDGIRFTVDRMIKYVQESRKDPLVIDTAREIAQLSVDTAEQLGRKIADENRALIHLEGIHAWCFRNFQYVRDPAGVKVIQTPQRQLRRLKVPAELHGEMWQPIREGMAAAAGKRPEDLTLPPPKMMGDSDEAVIVSLSLAAALDTGPLKLRFGGHDGTIHYVWGYAHAAGKWHDLDILLPKFGEHPDVMHYEDIEVPII